MANILKQSISLEKAIAQLYKLFYSYYEEDRIFWERMALDEERHANILEGLTSWIAMGADTSKLLLSDLQELHNKNAAIEAIIKQATEEPPTREIAFNLAYRIEFTASEMHFQKIMSEKTDSKLLLAMQELCNADKNHQKRIRKIMDTLGIAVIEEQQN